MRDHEAVFRERVARYQKKHGLRGFFSVWRWEGGRPVRLWTASILVKQAERTGMLEYGGLSYVLGEAAFAWKGAMLGEYYPYRFRGEHDHGHDFYTVLAEAVLHDGQVETEGEKDYAPWMLEQLACVNGDAALRCRLTPWAERPWRGAWRLRREGLVRPVILCRVGGRRRRCRDVETVYELAARCWRDFRLETPEILSVSQRENVQGILEYQRAAHAGTAD